MNAFLHNPIMRGAVSGALAAAVVDIHAFLSWKNVQDALAYNWSTAAFRWFQGAVTGAIAGAGFGSLVS